MSAPQKLGEFEQLVLLALMRLGADAYGVTMRREVESRTGREVSAGAIYTTLERMEKRGLVTSSLGEPIPGRRGRPRRYYQIESTGAIAVARSYSSVINMAEGLASELIAIETKGSP
jgi:PadR family transcriptional regulator PadR